MRFVSLSSYETVVTESIYAPMRNFNETLECQTSDSSILRFFFGRASLNFFLTNYRNSSRDELKSSSKSPGIDANDCISKVLPPYWIQDKTQTGQ